MVKVIIAVTALLVGAAVGAGGYWKYSGTPATELRWSNAEEIHARPGDTFKRLLTKNPGQHWENPTVTVYSAPYIRPLPAPVTLKDLSDSGQAHAIDAVFKKPGRPQTAWQALMSTVSPGPGGAERTDPYRVDRVLVATVAKGLDTLPGERLLWTRVFVQPINFQFAGYTVAATDSKSMKIASIENSTGAKLSINGGFDSALPGAAKPDVDQTIEKTQKASADVVEQYENLGIDIQPNFLRIIRESAPGGDVAGNAAIQLSMVTDPNRIWCEKPNGDCESSATQPADPDARLVLLVADAQLADGATEPKISVLPQNVLPHCPLKANVWMLYEIRRIIEGRQNYVEGMQKVALDQEGYDAGSVDIVAADDIAPAVWSIKVTDATDTQPVRDGTPDLTAQIENGSPRRLVFTDYLTASELTHWLKTQMAKSPEKPKLDRMTFQVDPTKTLTPFKHVVNDCRSTSQKDAAR